MDYPKLNYPPIRLRARRGEGGRTEVFDRVRQRWLVLTPEEWVRRHVVAYLTAECGYQPEQIVQEYPININGMAQRADIVVLTADAKPLLVVECKEPGIRLSQETLAQVVRYNSILGCRYVAITNGLDTFCYQYDGQRYTPIDALPSNQG